MNGIDLRPRRSELDEFFRKKYPDATKLTTIPRLRLYFNYFSPDDYYELLVSKLVNEATVWADVGSGRSLFPSNRTLACELAGRSKLLIGIDPDDTIEENRFVHDRAKCTIQEYRSEYQFDLVTLRMVAEHIQKPVTAVRSLATMLKSGGLVVVYTVNKWSPASLAAKLTPMYVHHLAKKFMWRSEKRDTFPVVYKMNSRRDLTSLFESGGFQELYFEYLDDCRVSNRFFVLQCMELTIRSFLRLFRIRYPENCLLAVYSRT